MNRADCTGACAVFLQGVGALTSSLAATTLTPLIASSGVAALHASSDAASTRQWLIGAGVSAKGLEALADFSAADVLALSKDDAKEILGATTGIRLWNRLHAHQLEHRAVANHGSIVQNTPAGTFAHMDGWE